MANIKLTDEVLRDIAIAFRVNAFDDEQRAYHKPTVERGKNIAEAIRALRDAARVLVIEVNRNPNMMPATLVLASGYLRELLPDEPKGGG